MSRSQKNDLTGSFVWGVREVAKGFVPARLDALKSPREGLAEQKPFQAGFSRLKIRAVF